MIKNVGFRRVRKIPAQEQPIQMGPKNVQFGKTQFTDQNIDTQIC